MKRQLPVGGLFDALATEIPPEQKNAGDGHTEADPVKSEAPSVEPEVDPPYVPREPKTRGPVGRLFACPKCGLRQRALANQVSHKCPEILKIVPEPGKRKKDPWVEFVEIEE